MGDEADRIIEDGILHSLFGEEEREMDHTPKPWSLEPGTQYNGFRVISDAEGNEVISWVADSPVPSLADAHLIAAAPSLLEIAEQMAVEDCESYCGEPEHPDEHVCWPELARAAVRKARGEG